MKRLVIPAVLAISLLFGGSLFFLARIDAGSASGLAAPPSGQPASAPEPTPPPTRPLEPRPVAAEVAAQLAAPPTAPAPVEPAAGLPPSGAPPAPAYVRESLPAIRARITSRCGRMTVRLGDQLRKDGLQPEGHAVLLLDVEPQDDGAKIWGSTVQSHGTTRQSLVACAQLNLRGLVVPVSYLRRGERVKVQVVVGVEE
jgi:hypothetical protein